MEIGAGAVVQMVQTLSQQVLGFGVPPIQGGRLPQEVQGPVPVPVLPGGRALGVQAVPALAVAGGKRRILEGGGRGAVAHVDRHRADQYARAGGLGQVDQAQDVLPVAALHRGQPGIVPRDLVLDEHLHPGEMLGRAAVCGEGHGQAQGLVQPQPASLYGHPRHPVRVKEAREHRPRSKRADDFVVADVEDDQVGLQTRQIAGDFQNDRTADGGNGRVDDFDLARGQSRFQQGGQQSRNSELRKRVALGGGLAQHHDPEDAVRLLPVHHDRARAAREGRVDEPVGEEEIVPVDGPVADAIGDEEAGGIADIRQPQRALGEAEEDHG